MRRARPEDLLFVSKSPKDRLDYLAAGASLVSRSGYQIAQLKKKAASDRLQLAVNFLKEAETISQARNRLNRTVVSRTYYCMYHALRSAAFLFHGGDDHEEHTKLPSKIPQNFPDHARWSNALKIARLERNKADYDPYPKHDAMFKSSAETLLLEAAELVDLVRKYIRDHQ